jgi:hypothetical protein
MANPFSILRSAIRAVPAVRYALGIVGMVAAIAIAMALRIGLGLASYGVIVMFVFMTMLVIFAALSKLGSPALRRPALVFTWFSLLLIMASALLLFSSAFLGFPALSIIQGFNRSGHAKATLGIVPKNVGIEDIASPDEIAFKHIVAAAEVLKGGPADLAAVRTGDIVEYIGQFPIHTKADFLFAESRYVPGQTVEIFIARKGEKSKISLTFANAEKLYADLCDRGDQAGCTSLGLFLYDEQGMKPASQTEYLFQNACESPYIRGCTALGMFLLNEHEHPQALSVLRDACTRGSIGACGLEGFMYKNGLGVPSDQVAAESLLRWSCNSGDDYACMQLGSSKELRKSSPEKAAFYLRIACLMGQKAVCSDRVASDTVAESSPRFEPGTAVGDLQALDKNNELYSDFDVLDDLQIQQDVSANP